MRVLILTFSLLGILVSADAAKAGPSTTARELSESVEPARFTDEAAREDATQATEDQIGLNKAKRRDVQRRLTRLGFDTKPSGKFDQQTRAVITRWQAARGYPETGFLNTSQHQAIMTESAATAQASLDGKPGGGSARRHRGGGIGGPVGAIGGAIGGVVGGVFGRR
jgi:peptidoglycan hydrolase-like protein with peptidoglycan-binding domain